MASFEKRGGRVRVHINMLGVRESETRESMGAARAWATAREAEIIAGARGQIPNKTFGELLQRYADKISPTKKGARWELVRIAQLQRDPIAQVPLSELGSDNVARWRDRRLEGVPGLYKPVKGASVRREWNLCSAACSVAIGEWKWLQVNPFSKSAGAKRPKNSPHRAELILEPDLAALQVVADAHPTPTHRQVMRAARFGIETAMRSGEIIFLGQNPERVDTTTRVAHLPDTKNGSARDVGLSLEAIRIWNEAAAEKTDGAGVWGLTDATRDKHWRTMRERAAAERPAVRRLHFHDTRHTAITRLAKKLQILDLARMAGITDLKILMVYYNESAASIALKLD